MERCPICKARLKAETQKCPRCSSDLSLLFEIEQQANDLLFQALEEAEQGALEEAVHSVEQSISLKNNPLSVALLGMLEREYDNNLGHNAPD